MVLRLLRNFVLVGGLKYFYEKSVSEVLFYLRQFAFVVIFLYCLSYADQWYVNLFGFLANRRVAHWLNRTVNITIAVLLFVVIRWGTSFDRGRDLARAALVQPNGGRCWPFPRQCASP